MKISGLYKITNLINGNFYLGSSCNIRKRFNRHRCDLKKNKHDNQHLQHAYNLYGNDYFKFEIIKEVFEENLLKEEQLLLDINVGQPNCYNIRKDAECPVLPGTKRDPSIGIKVSIAQKGIPKWTEAEKIEIGNRVRGYKHTEETLEKFKNRITSKENIQKAIKFNSGRIYTDEHGKHISYKKKEKCKKFTQEEINKIKNGVRKSFLNGSHKKNKIPLNEYENIKTLYLSKEMNQRQIAMKYNIQPTSMCKLLKRIGAK